MDEPDAAATPADLEDEQWLRLGVAATLAREYAADQRRFLEEVARMLERAIPGQVQVSRSGGLFSARRKARAVRIDLGDYRYTLEDPGQGGLAARRILVKRGIVLNSEDLPVPEWIAALCSALQEYALQHEGALAALRRLAP